jgi:deoxyadenosine/deoxycytidine kinase
MLQKLIKDALSVLNYEDKFVIPPEDFLVIFIEGCIGVGKTTLVQNYKEYLKQQGYNVFHYEEVVDQTLLAEFYKAPSEMEYMFQISMILSRLKNRIKAVSETICFTSTKVAILSDTGFLSNEAFIAANFFHGTIDQRIFKELVGILNQTESSVAKKLFMPTHVVLLDSSVDSCKTNIQKRGRSSERGIKEEYLSCLKKAYDIVYESKMEMYDEITFIKTNNSEFMTPSLLHSYIQP